MEYTVNFIESVKRTSSAISFRFSRPAGFTYTAGQYMIVTLGDDLVHPLSLSDSPDETGFLEFTKRMTGSSFCRKLQELTAGDIITLKGAMGRFTLDGSEQILVFLAGGIGITPIRSILKTLAKRQDHPGKAILIYGNVNEADISFREELEGLALPGYRVVHVLADTKGVPGAHQGYISAEIISREVPDLKNTIFMVSGPPVMVDAMQKNLVGLGATEEQIRSDVFLGYET
ncbi:MAG: FAD-dependent oxidoreductase [Proteobacteria bacterium]|nr:FAD-dependent oxidoreductase [Pseudomonadota bacterium]MBU4298179.1 FAD-dependent oxidoreductase [Pseudomonadota bacterium]MCG2749682.1 FAD-dependent oxidoreductase [Desulfobulbaceae bacterium]